MTTSELATPVAPDAGAYVSGVCASVKRWNVAVASPLPRTSCLLAPWVAATTLASTRTEVRSKQLASLPVSTSTPGTGVVPAIGCATCATSVRTG